MPRERRNVANGRLLGAAAIFSDLFLENLVVMLSLILVLIQILIPILILILIPVQTPVLILIENLPTYMHNDQFPIQSYTHKELADLYRCSVKTFKKWLRHLQKDLGPSVGHFYNPRQVRIIVDQLGAP